MSNPVRKQAPRLPKPVGRYWKGKAPKGAAEVESDSDADDSVEAGVDEEQDVDIGGDQDIVKEEDDDDDIILRPELTKASKSMNIALNDVNISREGKVIVAGREESGRTAIEGQDESEESSDEDTEAQKVQLGRESDEESSEDETESEEEKPKLQFRPVFIPKRNRATIQEKDALAQDSEESLKRKDLEIEERRKQSHDMVAESIRKELAEKEKEDQVPDVDDTDGLDPAEEFEAWRARELARITKEREAQRRRQDELEEIERRRALPEEQRLREDTEHAKKLRDEKPKGQQKFLQKYWHKGAFHQGEEILKRHDYTEATQSTVDMTMLPKVMQVKNFGKRSRTKYTHLLDQDTTVSAGGFGGTAPANRGGTSVEAGAGCFLCGGPHLKKDCPQNTEPHKPPPPQPDWRRNRDDRNSNWGGRSRSRDRSRGYGRSRSRSVSRTPPPSRSRRRDRSVDYDDYREKRRKIGH